jgi:glycerol-3-phosphate O-acyltransferase
MPQDSTGRRCRTGVVLFIVIGVLNTVARAMVRGPRK